MAPTSENLRHVYLTLNTRLVDMPEVFGISLKQVRALLHEHGIKKTQVQAAENSTKTFIARHGEIAFRSRGFTSSQEAQVKAKLNAAATKKANTLKRLAEEGITYDSLYELFIVQNLSITQVGTEFNRTKAQMRKLLARFEITKTPELMKEAQMRGLTELHLDAERMQEKKAKAAQSLSERYGNNWYRNTTSKSENELAQAVSELFPAFTLVFSSYDFIRNPATKYPLQLDIVAEELKLAIEFNGVYFHDKAAYLKDVEEGTCYSREALKDRLCADQGLTLLHVWSDDWAADKKRVLAEIASHGEVLELN